MKRQSKKLRRHRSMSGMSQMGEMPFAIFLVLAVLLFPVLDLLSFCVGLGMVFFSTDAAVRQAAACSTWSDAKQRVADLSEQLIPNSKAVTIVSPNPGMTLGLEKIDSSGTVSDLGSTPPDSAPGPISTDEWQYYVTAKYNVSPLINFQGSSMFSGIPAIGAPVPVSFVARAHVERTEGLHP